MINKNIILAVIIQALILCSCSDTIEKMKRVGKAPDLDKVDIPDPTEDVKEVIRREESYQARKSKTNSLWKPGSRSFIADSRLWKVGDILRVNVKISDSATLANSTSQSRAGSDSINIPSVFGKETAIATALSKNGKPSPLLSTNNTRNHNGAGNISRKEDINTVIAAVVTQLLPNGNLVISGKQEIRINHELREVKVTGIIRPRDISLENTISSDQIAEARISYGGKGIISDVQAPRTGSQIIDIISPF